MLYIIKISKNSKKIDIDTFHLRKYPVPVQFTLQVPVYYKNQISF